MSGQYLIACAGSVAERDRVLLKSLLSIVGQHGATAWVFSDSQDADVLVVDADTPAGRATLARSAPGQVPVAFSGGPQPGVAYWLPKPLRAREFMQLLRDIEAGREKAAALLAGAGTTAASPLRS